MSRFFRPRRIQRKPTGEEDDQPKPGKPWKKTRSLKKITHAGKYFKHRAKDWHKLHNTRPWRKRDIKWAKEMIDGTSADTTDKFLEAVGVAIGDRDMVKLKVARGAQAPHSKYDLQVLDLVRWEVAASLDQEPHKSSAQMLLLSYVRYFSVPKGNTEEDRAITSVKDLNAKLPKPKSFSAVDHLKLLHVLTNWLSDPLEAIQPSMATSDYLNHFYQFGLGMGGQPFFAFQDSKGKTYVMKVLPMGFSYSPRWAQSATYMVLYETRERWSKKHDAKTQQPEIPTDNFEDLVEIRNSKNEVVAYMAAIYDNIIILSKDETITDQLKEEMDGVNAYFNLKVKAADDDPAKGWEFNRTEAKYQAFVDYKFDPSRTSEIIGKAMTFLGVEYVTNADGVFFRHAPSNVAAWRREYETELLKEIELPYLAGHLSNRHVAEMVGVMVWDARVCLVPLSHIKDHLHVMSKIGKQMAGGDKADWDDKADLTMDECVKLRKVYSDMLVRMEKGTLTKATMRQHRTNLTFLCSDSSADLAAGVYLGRIPKKDGSKAHVMGKITDWKQEGKFAHDINWKETMVAIKTVRSFIQDCRDNNIRFTNDDEIVFGEDNTTAVAALNSFYYPKDIRVCGELFKLWEELQDMGGPSLTAFYVPTKDQAADEPSRRKKLDLAWQNKCERLMKFLDEQYRTRGGNF